MDQPPRTPAPAPTPSPAAAAATAGAAGAPSPDPARDAIVADELAQLARTHEAIAGATRRVLMDYDQELLSLRDQIAEARAEDLAPLVQQMERLQQIAARRAEVPAATIDPRSPYFGHMRLEENGRKRDVLIGSATYVDTERGVRVVDWRDAPVSKLYYRYAEGDEYEEEIAGRSLEGTVLVRRAVVILDAALTRVIAPQGTYVRDRDGWRTLDASASRLSGGQGLADRPPALEEYSIRRGRLGVRVQGRDDRHLPDIPALIDKRQFELISRPGSGLVVIQGGAGSGKTTIGLHRMAYLAFNDPRRFAPERMLTVVFNDALKTYISRVLPSLGVEGVPVVTYAEWAQQQRRRHVPLRNVEYAEDTPPAVSRLKKHPAMLTLIDERVARSVEAATAEVDRAVRATSEGARALAAWRAFAQFPLAARVGAVGQWLKGEREVEQRAGVDLANDTRLALASALDRVRARARDVVWDWAELLTDAPALRDGFARLAPGAFTEREVQQVVRYCADRAGELAGARGEEHAGDDDASDRGAARASASASARDDDDARAGSDDGDGRRPSRRPPSHRGRDDDDDRDDDGDDRGDDDRYRALDGLDEREARVGSLDREDDALLLRLYQRKRGPLRREKKQTLLYEHVFVDEAQDLSPVELAVLLDCVTPARSVTLAGDTAQRLHLDNGFTDWQGVLRDLGLSGVAIEPLRIGYRSTREVLEFAREVLGPLADPVAPVATRSGAPVEIQLFPNAGAAVAFLGEALRELSINEPRASVAVVARDPERADLYFEGLRRAEVPRLTRVRSQDFTFKAGVEVTDIRQVKGLEWDYVVLVDVDTARYPVDDESRHLLHIGATRAAHQLWLVATGVPSRLLPERLRG